MKPTVRNFVIVGLTSEGKRFRPSDWAERLCGIMSQFGSDHKMRYSPYVQPGPDENGAKTVRVDARLYDIEPATGRPDRSFTPRADLSKSGTFVGLTAATLAPYPEG